MNSIELGKRLYESSHLTGEFKLRSGIISNEYFDKYQFESDPGLLKEIAKQLAGLIPPKTEILAGLEMGGIPISTALSLYTGVPQIFVRKEAKKYGTEKLAEGVNIKGKMLTIVEDVITTGGQVVASANQLRQMEASVEYAICVIERNPQGRINLKEGGINLRALFTGEGLDNQKRIKT
jgi:orotate phosphoribosyltransferase